MAILNNSNAISSGGYDINNSLRLRSSASAYLNRTFGTPTNNRIFTWSGWVKRGQISTSTSQNLFRSGGGGSTTGFRFSDTAVDANMDGIRFFFDNGASGDLKTTQIFRDPSAWYHLVVAVDTTQATAANRVKMYVNGTQITAFGTATYPAQNYTPQINSAIDHSIGIYLTGPQEPFDGYMADINFIDGSAKTPSDFGETDTTTGVWKPKAYTGTYGTNGFYLKFSDIATTSGSNAGLGKDFSGNTNYWTTNNISVTAGVTYDAMLDSPTLTSATVANYATWNPLFIQAGGTTSNANLTYTGLGASGSGTYTSIGATMAVPTTGKWYWEIKVTQAGGAVGDWWYHGIMLTTTTSAASAGAAGAITHGDAQNTTNTAIYNETVAVRSNQTDLLLITGDIVQVAYDAGAAKLWFGRNNQWYDATTGFTGDPANGTNPTIATVPSGTWVPYMGGHTDQSSGDANFGQRPFTYTPPTGFKLLNTFNLPDSTIKKGNTVMDATLYTGTGTTQTITNAGSFKPDFVWLKARSTTGGHYEFDSVRGAGYRLSPDSTDAEAYNNNSLTSFNSNGFSLGNIGGAINGSGTTFVGWQWQAGQGSTSSNTSGSITSTVSVNATAGFSVVTFNTGTIASSATVGHGLGVAPKMVILKTRAITGTWVTYHADVGNTKYLELNNTMAAATASTIWNNTSPTSSVFTIGSAFNNQGNYVAYCWAEIAGYSKAFSYTGNGSTDGSFVFCGFRPKFVLLKSSSTADDWYIHDSTRNTYNVVDLRLSPNLSSAEVQSAVTVLDFLSNGFKLRTSNGGWNGSGNTYIGIAFAENPFKNSNAR